MSDGGRTEVPGPAQVVDVSRLDSVSQRAVERFAGWLRLMTAHKKEAGRFEAVCGEGKLKVIHDTHTLPAEQI